MKTKPIFNASFKIFQVLAVACVAAAAATMIHGGKAYAAIALNPDPGTNIPAPLKTDLVNCDSPAYNPKLLSPAYEQWLSPEKSPASTSVDVPYGTSSINLRYHYVGAICFNYPNPVLESRARVMGVDTAGVTTTTGGSIVGKEQNLNFSASPYTVGTYESDSILFQFAPGGPGFVKSDDYTIQIRTSNINRFASGAYICIHDVTRSAGGWNYGACTEDVVVLKIHINIVPPPVVVQTRIYGVNPDGTGQHAVTGVVYNTCDDTGNKTQTGVNAITGEKDFTVVQGKSYCIRITSGAPPGYDGPFVRPEVVAGVATDGYAGCGPYKATDPPQNHCSFSTYEQQVSFADNGGLDRGTDRGFAFVYVKKPPPSCDGFTTSPYPAEAGQPFTTTLKMAYGGGGSLNYTFKSVNIGGQSQPDKSGTYPTSPSQGYSGITIGSPGMYTLSWTITSSTGDIQCTYPFPVGNRPYLKIFGNDVAVGSNFADNNQVCTVTSPKTPAPAIWTFDKTVSQNADVYYGGGSTQFADFALGPNIGFVSAGNRNKFAAPTPREGLSFGNMVAGSSTNDYGGNYGVSRCIHNYFAASTKAGADLRTGNQTVSYSGAKQQVIFVKGDAYINGNVNYGSGPWASVSDIPSFYLIVEGNIYVDHNVSHLDGVYVAQPDSARNGTGRIYTCTNGSSLYAPTDLYANCGNKLTITGSFIADQVRYLRTNGTVGNSIANNGPFNEEPSSGNIAEVFNFSQANYLAPVPPILQTVTGGGSSDSYDSITSLPPIL